MRFNFTHVSFPALAAAGALLIGGGAAQAEVVYQENFTGGGTLNGSSPDTVSGNFGTSGATWNADGSFGADGTLDGDNDDAAAFLPFDPSGGFKYTLDVGFNAADGAPEWAQFGFDEDSTNGAGTGDNWNDVGNTPSVILRDKNSPATDTDIIAWSDTANNNSIGSTDGSTSGIDFGTALDYTLVFDATAGLDSVDLTASVAGNQFGSGTGFDFSDGRVDRLVLSKSTFQEGTFDNLTLEAVPTPGTLPVVLALVGGVTMIRRRRKA